MINYLPKDDVWVNNKINKIRYDLQRRKMFKIFCYNFQNFFLWYNREQKYISPLFLNSTKSSQDFVAFTLVKTTTASKSSPRHFVSNKRLIKYTPTVYNTFSWYWLSTCFSVQDGNINLNWLKWINLSN